MGTFAKFKTQRMVLNSDEEIYSQYLPGENARVFACSSDELWIAIQLVRRAYAEVRNVTGNRGVPRREVQFLLPEEKATARLQPFDLKEYAEDEMPLHSTARFDELIYEVLRALLWRQFCESNKVRRHLETPYVAAVDFIAAGLCNRIAYDGKGGNGAYIQDYRMARLLVKKNIFPRVEWLLTRPVPTHSQILFRIYAMHCDLLLTCLERTGRLPLVLERYWIEVESRHGDAPQALATALNMTWDGCRTLQAWYERSALDNCQRGRKTYDQEDIARQLEEALVIPVLSAESLDAIRQIPLEEVPELLKNYQLDVNAITELQQRLVQFRASAPPLFWAPLEEFNVAVELLRKRDFKDFQRQLALARQHFAEAMTRYRKVGELLDEAEQLTGTDANCTVEGTWLQILDFLDSWKPIF